MTRSAPQKSLSRSITLPQLPIGRWELAEVLLIVLAFFVYFGVRGLVVERVDEAEANARAIVSIEMDLGID